MAQFEIRLAESSAEAILSAMQKPRKLPRDPNALAACVVALSTGSEPPKLTEEKRDETAETPELPLQKNEAAAALGRLGGAARSEALSKKKRVEIARLAAAARWKKR